MKSRSSFSLLILIPLLLSFAAGCGFKKVATKASAQVFYDATPAIDRESDVDLAEQASLSFLKMLEGFYFQNPKDKLVLLLLARSYAGYAFGFTENDLLKYKQTDPAQYQKAYNRAKLFYGRAKDYGLALLEQFPGMRAAIEGSPDDFDKVLQSMGPKETETLFWVAFAWGNHLNFNKDDISAVVQLPKVEAMMKRVLELDADYYYGGPNMFLGAVYGSRPPMLGGNPDLAKQYFEKAIATTQGRNLMAPVTMAQFYAVQVQDVALYQKLLSEVLAADASALPEQRLSNELAKIRAQILLDNKSLFFTSLEKKKTKSRP